MLYGEDWLQDPLRKIESGSYKFRKLKSVEDKQNDLWQSFHFSTRLKLDAADYFCRQVFGAASRPDDLGLPLLAHRQLKWYLDAFFFELMSAYDTLLQELNIVYAYDLGLKPKQVRWDTKEGKLKGKLGDRLPKKLVEYMREERGKEWFEKVSWYRNVAAHHSYLWTGWVKGGWGDRPWDYNEHGVSIYYLDKTETLKEDKINVCTELLNKVVQYIHQVWEEMAREFQ